MSLVTLSGDGALRGGGALSTLHGPPLHRAGHNLAYAWLGSDGMLWFRSVSESVRLRVGETPERRLGALCATIGIATCKVPLPKKRVNE